MVPPQDIPNTGRFAILNDPQGAMFAVFKSSRDDVSTVSAGSDPDPQLR